MKLLKEIVEKLKLKELFGIVFISALFITCIPTQLATRLSIEKFRSKYQTYITLCIIAIGAYYVLLIMSKIWKIVLSKLYSWKKIAIKYMKDNMSADEMNLLIESFYDSRNKRFASSGNILYTDGRRTPLECKHVIYLASTVGDLLDGFSYNLQPYALEFLNKNLHEGNIKVYGDRWEWNNR